VTSVGDRVFFGFDSAGLPSDECKGIKGPAALTVFRPVGLDCRSPISSEYILGRQAAWLTKYPSVKVLIAGNADERGTETYNLALGQRRADVARDYLTANGVASNRITTISYGKDRPIDPSHDENAWQQNRNAITSVVGFNPQGQ
jgi:peptidoglycan-associated lipoprotein